MKEAISAIERAYGDIAEWPLISRPRQRAHSPGNVRISAFTGGSQSMGVIGIAEHAEQLKHTGSVQKSEGRENQVWVLHDSNSGALLAIMVGVIYEKILGWVPRTAGTRGNPTQTALRTGATSGVGYKHLSREDSRTAGLLGSGNQAITQLQALKSVRPIETVKIFSPSRDNREEFAATFGALFDLKIIPVDTAEKAVRGVDVVIAATNSNVPVVSGEWLEPGQHLSSIVGSNAALVKGGWLKAPRREIDDATIKRADVIVANSRDTLMQEQQGDLFQPIESGLITLEDIAELGEVIRGKRPGRTKPDQITFHKNNNGLGSAEMALAKLAYDKALAAGRGHQMDLPAL